MGWRLREWKNRDDEGAGDNFREVKRAGDNEKDFIIVKVGDNGNEVEGVEYNGRGIRIGSEK